MGTVSGESIFVWFWEPSILIGLAALTAAYILLFSPLGRRFSKSKPAPWPRQLAFHLGTLVVFLALVSPLDHLADDFLLSAHMVQHLLLLMVAPPLWLVGIPPERFSAASSGWLARTWRWLTRPLAAFLIFNVVLWVWHIPALYNAALLNEDVHILEHLMFLASAVVGWWPVLGFLPGIAPRCSYPLQILDLFVMMLSSTMLGAFISLARYPIYPFYENAPAVLNGLALPPLTPGPRLWGLSVMDDQ